MGELVQPGAVRQAHHAAVGPRDRTGTPARGLRAVRTFHPTFLYESIYCLLGGLALLWIDKQFDLRRGQLTALYVDHLHVWSILVREPAYRRRPQDRVDCASMRGSAWSLFVVGVWVRSSGWAATERSKDAPLVREAPPPIPTAPRSLPGTPASQEEPVLTATAPTTAPTTVAARAVDMREGLRHRRHRGERARRRHRRLRSARSSPPSWVRPARASPRCCTASPASTASRRARSSSATSRSAARTRSTSRWCGATASASCSSRTTWCPTLTGLENITLPLALAGKKADPEWLDQVIDTVNLADRIEPPAQRAVGWPAAAGGGRRGRS